MSDDVPDPEAMLRQIRAMPPRQSGSALAPHVTIIREMREMGQTLREIKAYLLKTVKVNRSVSTLQEFIAKDEKRERARRRRERMRTADPGRNDTTEDVEPWKSPAAKKQRSSQPSDGGETAKVNTPSAPAHGKQETLSPNPNTPRDTASTRPAPVPVAPRPDIVRPAGGSADFLRRLEEGGKNSSSTNTGQSIEDLRLMDLRRREERVRREHEEWKNNKSNPPP